MQTNSDLGDNVPRKMRSSDEVSWAVHRFKKRLAEELNGACPSCQKTLEYEVLTICLSRSACWDLFYTLSLYLLLFLYFLTFYNNKGSKWSKHKPLFAAGLDLKHVK
jgi:hypothetical protein